MVNRYDSDGEDKEKEVFIVIYVPIVSSKEAKHFMTEQ